MTVHRGKLAGVNWNWQWADEAQLDLVIPGGPGLMERILRDYQAHGGQWQRAFNFPYFWDGRSIGHTRKGSYVAPLATPTGPRPRLYSIGGKVRVSPNPAPRPDADWELEAGPLLVHDGKATDIAALTAAGDFRGIDPSVKRDRCALGYKDGRVVHIVSHTVATLHDVQRAALELGCEWCINGDGGRSVTLHQRSETPVSRAYDERPLPAVMVFREVTGVAPPPPEQPPAGELPITVDLIPKGRNNRPGHFMEPRYITIHDTANSNKGANAKMHAAYVKGDTAANLPVSWHYTVDADTIYQHLPLTESGWHAGDGTNGDGNRRSIGIEICQHSDGDRAGAERMAARLVAHLIRTVPSLLPFPECVVQHNRWSGKNCPNVLRGRAGGWDGFLASVQHELGTTSPAAGDSGRIRELEQQLTLARNEAAAAKAELQRIIAGIKALVETRGGD